MDRSAHVTSAAEHDSVQPSSTAVVTGGSRGIGRAIALRLRADGHAVCVVDRDVSALDELRTHGIVGVAADLGTDDDTTVIRNVVDAVGIPDILVNNAAITHSAAFFDSTPHEVRQALQVNLESPWRLSRLVADRLVEAGRPGSVVFVSSLHSSIVSTTPAYSVSKAGIDMLVREMAWACAPMGIRVNAVRPGWIPTAAVEDPSATQRSTSWVPLERAGTPDDVAALVSWLVSDAASYVTGALLDVDGGLSLHSWRTDEWRQDHRPAP